VEWLFEIAFELEVWLVLAFVGAAVLGLWWLLAPASRGWRLPMPRIPRISWRGSDVFVAFVLTELITLLVYATLQKAEFFSEWYGNASDKAAESRKAIWASALATPLILGLIVSGLQQLRRTRPAELGLTPVRAALNVRLGYLFWLAITPVTTVLYAVVLHGIEWLGGPVEKHPIYEAVAQPMAPVEWILLALDAVLLGPLLEELLFRGLLLPWQLRGGIEAQVTVAFCAVFFAALKGTHTEEYNPWPAVFVVCLLVPFFLLSLRRRTVGASPPFNQATLAVLTNGLFFAALHSDVWPSPVPLVLLGVALAWLRFRTLSLVGPVTLHALFNAVAMVELVCEQIAK
jgi:membrane protease YdiL (CAAX protease family)